MVKKIIHKAVYACFTVFVLKSKSFILSLYNFFFGETKEICIVKIDHIGDFIIWLGVAKQLREYYNDKKITLICSPAVISIAQKSGLFDEVIGYENNYEFTYKLPVKQLIGIKADTLILPTYSKSYADGFISASIYSKNKIYILSNNINIGHTWEKYGHIKYNRLLDTGSKPIPEIKRNQLFFNLLTNRKDEPKLADLSFAVGERKISEKYFVVNLGASSNGRMWGEERFASLSGKINENLNYTCVLVGGKKEEYLANKFLENYSGKTVNLIGKTNLSELISIINYAEFVLSNDTSTVHFSAALQTKCFAVVPGYQYPRFTSYDAELFDSKEQCPVFLCEDDGCKGCMFNNTMKQECIQKFKIGQLVNCMEKITVEFAYETAKNYLLKG